MIRSGSIAARHAFAGDLVFPAVPLRQAQPQAPVAFGGRPPRIGVIHNVRARLNVGRDLPLVIPGCDHVMPRSHLELHGVLASFVGKAIDLLVIDGGDGTVRDILSAIARHFPDFRPRIAIVPSGKTNALALDLGVRPNWTLSEAIVHGRIVERAPIEIRRDDADRAELAGFIFGNGAYGRATQLAQRTHRFGAFNGLAVGLSIFAGVGQTILAGKDNPWRRGEPMRVKVAGDDLVVGPQYLLLASTLRQMPLGIKPFGPPRAGMKLLRIEAPVRHMVQAVLPILTGTERAWLPQSGYHRQDVEQVDLSLNGGFVLDGETFAGGSISLRQGAPISFIVP